MRQIGILEYANAKHSRIIWTNRLKELVLMNTSEILQTTADFDRASLQFLEQPHDDVHAAIIAYMKHICNQGYMPGSVHFLFSVLKGWLKANRYLIDGVELDEIKSILPRNAIVTEDEYLNVAKIRTICTHGDSLIRAFTLLASSSGARIGEILSLDIDDIKYWEDEDVYYFKISAAVAKNGKPHRYYLSHEAYYEITEYLKRRQQYQDSRDIHTEKSLKKENTHNNKLFQLSQASIRRRLTRVLASAGMLETDTESGRITIHPHSFRKFADTIFKEHLGVNMGNELIGHDEGLSTSYRRYDPQKVAEAYRRVEPFVTIFAPADYVEIKERVSADVTKIQGALAAQALEMTDIKERLKSTEELLALALSNTKK